MSSALSPATIPQPPRGAPPVPQPGLEELLKAHETARVMNLSPWEFAVTLAGLCRAGLSETDLRALTLQGYLCHRLEKPNRTGEPRQFEEPSPFAPQERSCFLLTESGVAFVLQLPHGGAHLTVHLPAGNGEAPAVVPQWAALRRELRLGDQLIMQFLRPAPNREAILREFEASRWVRRIANPLTTGSGRLAKVRLQATIKDLNRCRLSHLIAFGGDGTGQGVLWHFVAKTSENPQSPPIFAVDHAAAKAVSSAC